MLRFDVMFLTAGLFYFAFERGCSISKQAALKASGRCFINLQHSIPFELMTFAANFSTNTTDEVHSSSFLPSPQMLLSPCPFPPPIIKKFQDFRYLAINNFAEFPSAKVYQLS